VTKLTPAIPANIALGGKCLRVKKQSSVLRQSIGVDGKKSFRTSFPVFVSPAKKFHIYLCPLVSHFLPGN